MLRGFRDLLVEVAGSDARVLIIRGEGGDFCVGADVAASPEEPAKLDFEELSSIYETGRMLHEMRQITFAAIDGGCAGPGLAWAAACDFRFASDRAVFNTAFLNVGVAGEMGLAWSLLRIVGGAWAREMLLFPGKFGAAEAHRLGLITRMFPAERLHGEVAAAAGKLVDHYAPALRIAKANILSAEALGLAEYILIEGARHVHLAGDDARLEGFRAFAEKRPPRFGEPA